MEIDRFRQASERTVTTQLALARLEALFSPTIQLLISAAVFAALWGGGLKAVAKELTSGELVAFIQFMGMLAWPLTSLSWAFLLFRKGNLSLGRIDDLLRGPTEDPGEEGAPPAGTLEVRGLWCRGLCDVSFTVRPGERIAIVGPVGAGKSTLLDVLLGLLPTPRGSVFFGGKDLSELSLKARRRIFAGVPQDGFLFSGTLRENIGPGAEEGFRAACLDRDGLAEGLDTQVGERGGAVSGGQRQRIALARALVRHAPVLVLDEPFSALDVGTEAAIREALPAGTTILLATHQVWTAGWADRVLVLDEGRLVEAGSPAELVAREGLYAELVRGRPLEA